MYSESDIDAAVSAGAISAEAALGLRNYVSAQRATPLVDEESFRLLTGFNDIFVSIATILLLVAVAWLGSSLGSMLFYRPDFGVNNQSVGASMVIAGVAVAGAGWMLAEYFTARRRMALPSILLLLAFVGAVAAALAGAFAFFIEDPAPRVAGAIGAVVGLGAAIAALLHWRRFRVPITIAALTIAVVGMLVGLLMAVLPQAEAAFRWLLLIAGIGVFAFAMRWDMTDRARQTRRSDVAFWLHLAAAPMIAHPLFWTLGVTSGDIDGGRALLVIALYVFFGLVALAADRRALLVSSLFYVLYAMSSLFERFGAVGLNVALTALVIGSGLLTLSAFWAPIRRLVVERLPGEVQAKLPALDRVVVGVA